MMFDARMLRFAAAMALLASLSGCWAQGFNSTSYRMSIVDGDSLYVVFDEECGVGVTRFGACPKTDYHPFSITTTAFVHSLQDPTATARQIKGPSLDNDWTAYDIEGDVRIIETLRVPPICELERRLPPLKEPRAVRLDASELQALRGLGFNVANLRFIFDTRDEGRWYLGFDEVGCGNVQVACPRQAFFAASDRAINWSAIWDVHGRRVLLIDLLGSPYKCLYPHTVSIWDYHQGTHERIDLVPPDAIRSRRDG